MSEEINFMCDALRSVGILSIRGDATNYWATVNIPCPKGGLPYQLDSGYDHQSIEDAVYALFQSFTEWSLK